MTRADSMAKAFRDTLAEYAAKNGLTLQQAFEAAMTPDPDALKRKWGALPDQYDPRTDPSHPSKGFTPGSSVA